MKRFLKNKNAIFIVLLTTISIIFTVVLFRNGLLRGHDIEFHLSRIKGLRDSIGNGDFLALIHDGLFGYGYANGLFYGNLYLYIPALLSLLGLSLSKSYFVLILLCNILTPLIAYYAMKKVTKSEKASFITALLYSFSAYRICDVVVRAAIGEVFAFMIFPIVLLGLYYILLGDYKKWWVFSIGYVLLIQAHIISTILLTIIIVCILFFNINKFIEEKVRFRSLIYSGILGLLLGAFFIFPLLEQYSFSELVVNNLSNDVNLAEGSIKFERIFLGLSYFSEGVFYPPGVGIIFIICSLLRFRLKTDNKCLLKISDTCMIFGLIILLLITPFFPWKELSKYLKFMQFPWRLYIYSTLFLSISSGIILFLRFNSKKTIIFLTTYVMLFLIVSSYFNFRAIHNYWGVSGMEYINGYDGYYVANGEYLPNKTDINELEKRGNVITADNEDIKIEYTKKGNSININYSNNLKNSYIEIPLLYYLGYGTDKDYKLEVGDNNIVKIKLDKPSDNFRIYYKGTIIQKVSYLVSFLSLGLLLLIIKRQKRSVKTN